MAILNATTTSAKIEASIEKAVDELYECAKARLDLIWDDASGDTISKIHADIMAETFTELGKRMIRGF